MMKNESSKTVLAILVLVAVAAGFWLIVLSPKRDQVSELKEQATTLTSELADAEAKAEEALAAKKDFGTDYARLVQLGKAVPGDAATSSLLVELEALGAKSHTAFNSISLGGGEAGGSTESEGESGSEAGKALPPLGSKSGPSGLLSMPYSLEFQGGFFETANFIQRLNALVKTKDGAVDARGRLITIDAFELAPKPEGQGKGSSSLQVKLDVSTYVTPPGQGLTAGATATGPANASYEP
jgi:Tfp pilus assembly protein PilO